LAQKWFLNFDELYENYSNQVFNLALQYVQNREDAEEITQDVFVSVHRSLHKFDNRSLHSTWIYRIAINKSLDYLRAKKRRNFFSKLFPLTFNSVEQSQQTMFNHPGVDLEEKENLQRLFNCLNSLPEKQKTALILMRIEGKSQKETAEIMKLSPKAVESLVQRGKKNMSDLLKKNEGS
jgi:RNA polymerase sigma factor (sigma-70 family)